MASRGDASNPFWWVVLGFICGAVATLGVLILHGSGGGEDRDEPSSEPEASAPLEPARPAPPPVEPEAPVVAPASSEPEPAAEPAPALDPQIVDDAAATGMTARSPRN